MSVDDREAAGADDPFEGLVLDEAFVRGARKVEGSATDRSDAAGRARSAHAELQARQANEVAASAASARSVARRRRTSKVMGIVAVAAIVVVTAIWFRSHPLTSGRRSFNDVMSPLAQGDRRPTPSAPASDHVLGYPASTSKTGPHEFIAVGPDGQPATYDPCRPISIVVNPRRAPFDADYQLESALAEVTRETGLQFVVEGTTDEKPSEHRDPFQPERYGDRWAPVLVAWSDQGESPTLGPEAIGTGGSVRIEVDGHLVFVSGQITLDGPALNATGQSGGGAETRAVIMHELGHVVGLGHVLTDTELMYDDNVGKLGFGDGDREGLSILGRGPCIRSL